MSRLPPPEQWVLARMNEMECAEMIERHIDFYKEYQDGTRHSVHLPMSFVQHYLQRHDGALPTVVAIATAPIVLADGGLLAPEGLDRERGIVFIIPKELRALIPAREQCTRAAVRRAMRFLCDEWLVDVATGFAGLCTLIAAALTLIERSLLDNRPAFFITSGRRGGGKTTTLTMLIKAVTGIHPAAAAWSTNEEERRKALLAYFMYGVPYILWDNIARGTQISCPHIEKSCTASYYSDRKLGVSEMVATAASTIHLFTGNNIGPWGDLASRSLHIRLEVDRADPENRDFTHSDPIGWTDNHRAEILAALYTILLGNPQLDAAPDAAGKTRFKLWWRVIGSAVEHAASLAKPDAEVDFQRLFLAQEEDDEEAASLADVLSLMLKRWPPHRDGTARAFQASEVATIINNFSDAAAGATLRDFLYPGAPLGHGVSAKSVGQRLKKHIDEPVKDGDRTLALRTWRENEADPLSYYIGVS